MLHIGKYVALQFDLKQRATSIKLPTVVHLSTTIYHYQLFPKCEQILLVITGTKNLSEGHDVLSFNSHPIT